jgi:hypothetical protein
MNLEDQVVSLDLSRRLKELRVYADCLFSWARQDGRGQWQLELYPSYAEHRRIGRDYYKAYTVSELSEMLPAYIDTKKDEPFNNYYLKIIKRTAKNIQWIANYECDSATADDPFFKSLYHPNIYGEKLADVLGTLLISLIEDDFVKVEDINK